MYNVDVIEVEDDGRRFSVFARVNQETFTHVFPKGDGWLSEDEEGTPAFIKELIEIYKKRYESVEAQGGAGTFEGESFDLEDGQGNSNIKHQNNIKEQDN